VKSKSTLASPFGIQGVPRPHQPQHHAPPLGQQQTQQQDLPQGPRHSVPHGMTAPGSRPPRGPFATPTLTSARPATTASPRSLAAAPALSVPAAADTAEDDDMGDDGDHASDPDYQPGMDDGADADDSDSDAAGVPGVPGATAADDDDDHDDLNFSFSSQESGAGAGAGVVSAGSSPARGPRSQVTGLASAAAPQATPPYSNVSAARFALGGAAAGMQQSAVSRAAPPVDQTAQSDGDSAHDQDVTDVSTTVSY
jgi:hypothetical protein